MVEFADSFGEENNFAGGIRRAQALDAVADPDGQERREIGDSRRLILTTKRITKSARQHVMLLIGEEQDGKLVITRGFRLFGSNEKDLDDLVAPADALAALLVRYGVDFSLTDGGPTERYVRSATVKAFAFAVRGNLPNGTDVIANAFVKRHEDGSADVSEAWAVNMTAYRAAASAH